MSTGTVSCAARLSLSSGVRILNPTDGISSSSLASDFVRRGAEDGGASGGSGAEDGANAQRRTRAYFSLSLLSFLCLLRQ